jgi:hypothetical protein
MVSSIECFFYSRMKQPYLVVGGDDSQGDLTPRSSLVQCVSPNDDKRLYHRLCR